MTQTDAVLGKFSQARVSDSLLARTMNIAQTTVAGWRKRGVIPAQQQPGVMEAAAKLNVALEPKDFFPPYAEIEAA